MTSERWDDRSRRLLGDEALLKLQSSTVLVVGLGGVGGYVAEMLGRSGVGNLILVDADDVSTSNINRQLIATSATVGQPKSELWRKRLLAINPEINVDARQEFVTVKNAGELIAASPDFVADAIDTIAPKLSLIEQSLGRCRIISSMGAGGRLNPTEVRYGTLADTKGDGLARVLRQRLRKKGIDPRRLPVVWSEEQPASHAVIDLNQQNKRSSFGTLATIPALYGIYMANYIIREITGI